MKRLLPIGLMALFAVGCTSPKASRPELTNRGLPPSAAQRVQPYLPSDTTLLGVRKVVFQNRQSMDLLAVDLILSGSNEQKILVLTKPETEAGWAKAKVYRIKNNFVSLADLFSFRLEQIESHIAELEPLGARERE